MAGSNRVWMSVLIALVVPAVTFGQTASASKFTTTYRDFLRSEINDRAAITNGVRDIDALTAVDRIDLKPGHTYDVLISTSTIPFTFSRLVKGDDKKFHIGSQLGIGFGYLAILGKMTPNQDGTVRVDPGLVFGPAGDVGVREDGGQVKTAFSVGGIIGFNMLALTAGYDFTASSVYLGLSSKLDFFALKKDAFLTHWVREADATP